MRIDQRIRYFCTLVRTVEAGYIRQTDLVLDIDLHAEGTLVSHRSAYAEVVIMQAVQGGVAVSVFLLIRLLRIALRIALRFSGRRDLRMIGTLVGADVGREGEMGEYTAAELNIALLHITEAA